MLRTWTGPVIDLAEPPQGDATDLLVPKQGPEGSVAARADDAGSPPLVTPPAAAAVNGMAIEK
jgi:hypothetical protein